jgi:integrase
MYKPELLQALSFLQYLVDNFHVGYSALRTATAALSSILILPNGIKFGSHPDVSLFLRGAYNLNPPPMRYAKIWSADTVLDFLKTIGPAHKISLKELSLKTSMLLLLVSGQRGEALLKLRLDQMDISDNAYTFTIDRLKQSRQGYLTPQLKFQKFPANRRLCIYQYLSIYIDRTHHLRGSTQELLVSFQKPHHAISRDTLSRWIKSIMAAAGIDISIFKSHSTRSASTSAAERGGATLQEILITAGWSQESTFSRYYKKPIIDKKALAFDKAVLKKHT